MEPRYPIIATFLDGLVEGQLSLLPDERRRHVYIVGRSGSGKSTLLYKFGHDRHGQRRWPGGDRSPR